MAAVPFQNGYRHRMYVEHGKMVGNFTTCALLRREEPADAEAFKRRFGLTSQK
jgi:hypothetical protein